MKSEVFAFHCYWWRYGKFNWD